MLTDRNTTHLSLKGCSPYVEAYLWGTKDEPRRDVSETYGGGRFAIYTNSKSWGGTLEMTIMYVNHTSIKNTEK